MSAAAEWLQVAQNIVGIGQGVLQIIQAYKMWELMENMVKGSWLLEQARKYGIEFDQLLLTYCNQIYNYFVQILEGNLFTPSIIDGIMNRLYVIVGLVIFFKLATLAIKYIASPEAFLDGKTGGEQLIKRIIFGCVVIILMPLIFDTALNLQSAIIGDNLIGKILLPEDIFNDYQSDKDNTGKKIGMMIVSGFFSWNDSVNKQQYTTEWNQYDRVVKYNDLQYFEKEKINNKSSNGEYIFSYVPIVSTLAIGYYLLTLLKYAAEVVMRSFKLAFLQIIAPFSIVKWMLDPADNESLKKWINTTVSTYIMLFLRVLTVWIIAMMAYYLKNGVPTDSGVVSLITADTDEILKALIVLGMFAFLKDLPKLISELFGYNLQENETIAGVANQAVGAIKGFALGKVGLAQQKEMMGLGMAANITGAVAGGLGGAANTIKNSKTGVGVVAGIGAGISGSTIGIGNAIGGQYSNAISANFGSSPIGSLGHGSNTFSNTSSSLDNREGYGYLGSEEQKEDKKAKKATDDAINATFNNKFQNKFQQRFDLSNDSTLQKMCESIQGSLQRDAEKENIPAEKVPSSSYVREIFTSERLNLNLSSVSRSQIETVYRTASASLKGSDSASSDVAANQSRSDTLNQNSQITNNNSGNQSQPVEPQPVRQSLDISQGGGSSDTGPSGNQ